jgi:uncharacterized membrane protein
MGQAHAAERARIEAEHVRIQAILRGGLVVSLSLMAIGVVLHLATGDGSAPSAPLFGLPRIVNRADSLLALGVLVLAATPAVRVVALLVFWLRAKDLRFAAVAFAVILTLLVAVALGRG